MSESETLRLVPTTTDEERKEDKRQQRRVDRRAYYVANRERIRAEQAAYQGRNKEARRAQRAVYNAAHREQQKQRSAAWYAANTERAKAKSRECHARDRGRFRAEERRRKYGLGPEAFSVMVEMQSGLCAICKAVLAKAPRGAHVDHDHTTGRVRGLLCMHCNRGLGGFRDTPEFLASAIAYLRPEALR